LNVLRARPSGRLRGGRRLGANGVDLHRVAGRGDGGFDAVRGGAQNPVLRGSCQEIAPSSVEKGIGPGTFRAVRPGARGLEPLDEVEVNFPQLRALLPDVEA